MSRRIGLTLDTAPTNTRGDPPSPQPTSDDDEIPTHPVALAQSNNCPRMSPHPPPTSPQASTRIPNSPHINTPGLSSPSEASPNLLLHYPLTQDTSPSQSDTTEQPQQDSPVHPHNRIAHWNQLLDSTAPEDFAAIVREMATYDSSIFPNINGKLAISLLSLQHYCFGEWQSSMELTLCLEAFAKLYNIDIYSGHILHGTDVHSLLRGTAIGQWSRRGRFTTDPALSGPLDLPYITGLVHHSNHFVVVYICREYWTGLDPLHDHPRPPGWITQANVHRSLRRFYQNRDREVPHLPQYRQLPRISIQDDQPHQWSCGTIALLTLIHIILGAPPPHVIPDNNITQLHTYRFHQTLL